MERDQLFFLMLLDSLLLELRNLEPNELVYAPKLAYMFHNIPSLLVTNFENTSGNEAFEMIRGRAEALGLTPWLDVCEQNAISARATHSVTPTPSHADAA